MKETKKPWATLPTEAIHPASRDLDRLSTREAVTLLLEEDRRGIEQALAKSEELALAATWVAETLEAGGDVVLVGAGTSGRLGILEAAECPPTFGTDPRRIRAEMAGGREAVFAAREGAEDRAEDGEAIAQRLGKKDLLIAISASSVTPFARGALAATRARGLRTVLLTCASAEAIGPAGGLTDLPELILALDTGPEILTGSTRLKAGSATKAALNAITTAAMIRLGKVYESFMVDLKQGSEKLRDRAVRIVVAAGRIEAAEAARLLADCDGEVKTAIVAARLGIGPREARERLNAAAGHVRAALTPLAG
jgi:N-acetylmuramic acid 6-phosphate etherase